MSHPIDTTHPSPNHDPRTKPISMLVLHATVGGLVSSINWLCNPSSRVSTHYVISKAGAIYQLVPDTLVAWHAGRSLWHGVTDVNARSIGVELENANDGRDPYPAAQLAAAHWLCQEKVSRYNIERGDVVRHLDIVIPRGRKTDPAGLPWPAFANSLYLDVTPPDLRYRVRLSVTAGATIRSGPRTNAAVLGRLSAGDSWVGTAVPGQTVSVSGFGSSNQWVRDNRARFVWSGLLEEVL